MLQSKFKIKMSILWIWSIKYDLKYPYHYKVLQHFMANLIIKLSDFWHQ